MFNVVIQKNNKDEPTGQLIIECINPETKKPMPFKRAGDSKFVMQPLGFIELLQSAQSQKIALSKITRAYADGNTFHIDIKQLGVDDEIDDSLPVSTEKKNEDDSGLNSNTPPPE